jgi:hypothetical protein
MLKQVVRCGWQMLPDDGVVAAYRQLTGVDYLA